jgi:hypothetical protein
MTVLLMHAETAAAAAKSFAIKQTISSVPEEPEEMFPGSWTSYQTWPTHWPRPARLLTPPQAIETVVLLPDHRRRVSPGEAPGEPTDPSACWRPCIAALVGDIDELEKSVKEILANEWKCENDSLAQKLTTCQGLVGDLRSKLAALRSARTFVALGGGKVIR